MRSSSNFTNTARTGSDFTGNIKISSLLKKSTEKQRERERKAELEALVSGNRSDYKADNIYGL